jgi:hypothetical protein
MGKTWSKDQTVLVLAPHLCLPDRNGADISIERVSRFMSLHCSCVELVGQDFHRCYVAGAIESDVKFQNAMRDRRIAGLLTLFKKSHYLLERFNTRCYRNYIKHNIKWHKYETVIVSFLTTLELVPKTNAHLLVWTHNDELKWFKDRINNGENILSRQIARESYNWILRYLPKATQKAILIYVSESDRKGVETVVPNHKYVVVQIGTDVDEAPEWVDPSIVENQVLTFIGSLSVQMNYDALLHFSRLYQPILKIAFGGKIIVRIVGSNPSHNIKQLVQREGWELYENVTDADLARLLRESLFTFLPFPYAAGVKLKMLRSLGSGVPFLSTSESGGDPKTVPDYCCVSNDPAEWINTINRWLAVKNKGSARKKMIEIARNNSWGALVSDIIKKIQV